MIYPVHPNVKPVARDENIFNFIINNATGTTEKFSEVDALIKKNEVQPQ